MKSESKGEGTYNVVVIGAGTAGLVTAAGTAGLGGRVALIERNKMGGDCLNFGCVPSKALISSARLIRRIRDAEKWGWIDKSHVFHLRKSSSACATAAPRLRRTIRRNVSNLSASMFFAAEPGFCRRTKFKSATRFCGRRILSLPRVRAVDSQDRRD